MATRPVSYALLLALTALPLIAIATTSPRRALLHTCQPGVSGNCSREDDSECCQDGLPYRTFACSPRITRRTSASLELYSFAEKVGGGGRRTSCDGRFHPYSEMVVALSTGWFSRGRRCGKRIVIRAIDGSTTRTARATVVDECDSMRGCDEEHDFKPPCANDVIGGSIAVWMALGFGSDTDDSAEKVEWSDA